MIVRVVVAPPTLSTTRSGLSPLISFSTSYEPSPPPLTRLPTRRLSRSQLLGRQAIRRVVRQPRNRQVDKSPRPHRLRSAVAAIHIHTQIGHMGREPWHQPAGADVCGGGAAGRQADHMAGEHGVAVL